MNFLLLKLKSSFPPGLGTILLLFLATRIVLTLIGVVSHVIIDPYHGHEFVWHYSKHLWLNIWAVWDSGWYLDIAKNGYSLSLLSDLPKNVDPGQTSFGFFPLYPMLIAALGFWNGHYLVAGIIASNACLLLSAWYLYKLVLLDFPRRDALLSVKYLFFFPTAFILSGVFAESLFLLLSIMSFYFLRKKQWLRAGCAGALLGLCRPSAVFVLPVLCLAYFLEKGYKPKNIRWDALCLLGIPLGYGLFSLFGYFVTGDPFYYTTLKRAAWGSYWANPFFLLAHCLVTNQIVPLVNGWAVVIGALLVALTYKKAGTVNTLLGLCLLILPLTAGYMVLPGTMRYMASVYPLFIAGALLGRNQTADTILTVLFCLLQGFLMAIWCNGFNLIV
ncbi:MAG TPA: hypothetical protein VLX68_05975 [Chitinivibrionales bacterium]|nr:hypothetical protein [Chitinivibrionales bacterium]